MSREKQKKACYDVLVHFVCRETMRRRRLVRIRGGCTMDRLLLYFSERYDYVLALLFVDSGMVTSVIVNT